MKYRGLFFLSLCVSLVACSPNEGQIEDPLETQNPNRILLSEQQMAAANLELGSMEDYSFGTSTKINGIMDVPPEGRAQISSYYGGYVRNLLLLTGQQVKKGERLFSLENPEFVQMQQDYLDAKSQLVYLQSDFERQKTLSQENIASQKNFIKSETEYNSTLARVKGLEKKLKMLHINPETIKPETMVSNISVIAPISGFITEVNVVNGTFLGPTELAASLINTAHIHLDLNIFEKNISTLKKGQTIMFRVPDAPEKTYEAEVFMVGKAIEPDNRMINIHAHLKDEKQNELFTPGMYVEAEIYGTNGISKALPEEAVVEVSGSFFTLVIIEESPIETVFEKREIKKGIEANGRIEVLNAEDFGPSDKFLVKGAFNLLN